MILRDITMFPHATGRSDIKYTPTASPVSMIAATLMDQAEAHTLAFADAVVEFSKEYGRQPDYDVLLFRGGHTSTEVVCEIWEEV